MAIMPDLLGRKLLETGPWPIVPLVHGEAEVPLPGLHDTLPGSP